MVKRTAYLSGVQSPKHIIKEKWIKREKNTTCRGNDIIYVKSYAGLAERWAQSFTKWLLLFLCVCVRTCGRVDTCEYVSVSVRFGLDMNVWVCSVVVRACMCLYVMESGGSYVSRWVCVQITPPQLHMFPLGSDAPPLTPSRPSSHTLPLTLSFSHSLSYLCKWPRLRCAACTMMQVTDAHLFSRLR